MTIFTADVSSWDGQVDWAQARQAGISGCAVKATEGGDARYRYTNPGFAQQYNGAVEAGVALVGAYHCLMRGGISQQISYFQQAYLGAAVKSRPAAGWHEWFMLDVEPFPELTSRGLAPTFADVEEFAHSWWDLTHLPLALYLPRWVWLGFGQPSLTGLPPGALISSNYPNQTLVPFAELYSRDGAGGGPGWQPYGGRTPDLWQFASSALIPGVRGGQAGADINAYRGDIVSLQILLAGAATIPPVPTPTGDPMLTHWTTVQRGSTGDAVRVAQGLLLARGCPVGSVDGKPDGNFGPVTENSTHVLQAHYGITQDGQFGPHTLSVALYGRDLA